MAGPVVTPPTNAAGPVSTTVIGTLQQMSWNDISFPCEKTSLSLRQDLTIHKYADRDGAHVEGCGRHPFEVTARLPFFNGLTPGPQETWDSTNLFPATFQTFLALAMDRTSKPLQHPFLGTFTAKISTLDIELDPDRRNGVWVNAKWIESDDTNTELDNNSATWGYQSNAAVTAPDIDDNAAQLPSFGLTAPSFSLTDELQSLQGTITAGEFAASRTQATINNMIGQINGLDAAITSVIKNQRALYNTVQSTNYPAALLWPILNSGEQLKDALYTMQSQLLQTQPGISIYKTTNDLTLSRIAAIVRSDINSLMELNVWLVPLPFVPAGTSVQYYTPNP